VRGEKVRREKAEGKRNEHTTKMTAEKLQHVCLLCMCFWRRGKKKEMIACVMQCVYVYVRESF
jgi:hypothetical protein